MGLDWANVSGLEIAWTVPACLAFLATLGLMRWVWVRFLAIRSGVHREPERYRAWGPRWNFTVLLLVAMAAFGIGWLGYIGLGLVAMATPPPIREANQDASDWFAVLLIMMEAMHAAALGLLWAALWSLSAPAFMPSSTAEQQQDRIEATVEDTNERIKSGDIGRTARAVVAREQADSIHATGEESAGRLRRGGIGDDAGGRP